MINGDAQSLIQAENFAFFLVSRLGCEGPSRRAACLGSYLASKAFFKDESIEEEAR